MRVLTSATCQRRFGHTDSIDASVDDLHCLIRGRLCQSALRRASQGPGESVSGRRKGPTNTIAEIDFLLNRVPQLLQLGRITHLQDDSVVSAGSFRVRFLYVEARLFGSILRSDCTFFRKLLKKVFNLHPHYQVRSTSEVQPEIYVLSQILFDARWGKVPGVRPAPVRPDHHVESDQGNDRDNDRSLE